MLSKLRRVFVLALAVLFTASPLLHAQGSAASSLSGTVTDSGGGVIPGATVIVKNNATGVTTETTTNSAGAFSVPALDPGTYTVTVSLSGFKTAAVRDLRLVSATPANVQVKLEVGTLEETVEVRAAAALVQTQSTAVTATLATEQLKDLPLVSRNALYAIPLLPGVSTAGGPRGSTINGLPNNAISVTIDGVSTGNALQSTDGFFTMVTPRLDAVEEVTVTGATPGASSSSGAVQVAFTTRSGTNEFDTSLYHTIRDPRLNSNSYFNKISGLERNDVRLHSYGGRVGGPIIIPGLYNGRNKAFFFFNMEHQYQPSEATRTRTILNPAAQQGNFSYLRTVGGQQVPHTVNLLAIGAASSNATVRATSTADPTIAALLNRIRETTSVGTVFTPLGALNTESFRFQASSKGNQYAPTGRLDYNLNDSHRLSGSYYWQRFLAIPDLLNNSEQVYPGIGPEGHQTSYRTTGSISLRSTLKSNMVNELRGGWQWSPNNFFGNTTAADFEPFGGYYLNFPTINDPSTANQNNPAPRNTANYSIENTVNWQKGTHSLSFGGGFQRLTHEQNSRNNVQQLDFGVDTNGFDPANSLFTTANFPGASTAVLNEARNIYSILTGRLTGITATARLDAATGQYVYLGNLLQKSRMDSFDVFAADSWRLTPTVTLNYGLRWDVQLPFTPVTNTWSTTTLADLCGASGVGSGPGGRACNMFQPGNMPAGAGFTPTYTAFSPGTDSYEMDWNNFGPNVGVAWRPNVQGGWLARLLGDPEQATVRAGYTLTYGFERMDRFTALYGGNPGGTTVASRNYGTGFPLLAPGQTVGPVLFRDRSALGAPAFQAAPVYPIAATAANSVNLFDPKIETPYVHQFSAGFQRSLGRDMAFEVRYVGNRNKNAWQNENWNAEETLFENNFFDEFRLAQANLAANVAAGRGATFRYFGPGTGTSPLPTYLAYFSGVAPSQAGNASLYTSTNFSNSAWTGHLGYFEPDVADAANDLHASTTFRANAIRAGLPANFFVMNPAITNANITRSVNGTKYDSLQIELRRRLSKGLLVNANYTYAVRLGALLESFRRDRVYLQDQATERDVPHAFKFQWVYQVPVGRGKRFGSNMNSVLNAVLGNWEWSGTGRVHRELYDMGSVRVVGMSMDELQAAFKIRKVVDSTGTTTIFSFPEDITLNTRRAFSTDPTSVTGYSGLGAPEGRYIAPASSRDCVAIYVGDCGAPKQVLLLSPLETRFDMRLNKRFPFGRKANFELALEVLNVFNNINFTHNATPGGGEGTYQVTAAYSDINSTNDPGGRIGQIQWRFSW